MEHFALPECRRLISGLFLPKNRPFATPRSTRTHRSPMGFLFPVASTHGLGPDATPLAAGENQANKTGTEAGRDGWSEPIGSLLLHGRSQFSPERRFLQASVAMPRFHAARINCAAWGEAAADAAVRFSPD